MNLIHRTNAEPYNIHYGENELLSLKLKLVGTIYNGFFSGTYKKNFVLNLLGRLHCYSIVYV